jgi:glutamate decarboxylase
MSKKKRREAIGSQLVPTYAARELAQGMPKHRMSESGMAPNLAYQVIHDELRLDGFSLLNLATFVTT